MAGILVPFAELGVEEGDSPSLTVGLEDAALTRRLILDDWDDAYDAAMQLLGYAEVSGSLLSRTLPQEDFEIPGLWASHVNRLSGLAWQGKTDHSSGYGSTNTFKRAVLEVQFLPRPYAVLGDDEIGEGDERNEFLRFVETETTLEGDYLTIPVTGQLKFSEGPSGPAHPNGAQPFPGNVGKVIGYSNYLFRWHQVPDLGLPEGTILDTIGRVNKTAFGNPDDPTGRLYFPEPGTLLVLGASWRRTFMFTPAGVAPAWVVEYVMKYRAQPWNDFLDIKSDPLDFYQITTDGIFQTPGSIDDGKCLYDERELADLFDVP
jgi:hypothetical protein